jgi:V-type H+-transporting ATPase subunit H
MSFTASIDPSPVAAAFGRIEHDPVPLVKLRRVLDSEKETLRAAESNPLDYTLADRAEATAYVRLLLKVLNETAGIGPSPRVSHVKERLSDDEAIELLHTDSTGVLTHYAIAKLNEIVVCLKERTSKSGVSVATTFYNDSGVLIDDYRPLVRILHLGGTGDAYAQRGAALILAQVLIKGCPSQQKRTASVALKCSSVQEPLQALVSWIASQLQSSSRTCLNLVMPSLMTLMACPEARTMFENGGGIGYLTKHLRRRPNGVNNKRSKNNTGASVQQLYELCFCLWTLTYDLNSSGAVRTHFARDGTVGALVDLVAEAPREKVVRVAIFALCNLATCIAIDNETNGKRVVNAKFFLTEMIGCGLFKSIERMKERQWTDPDIVEDLNLLYKLLQSTYNEMSRFDVYSAEIVWPLGVGDRSQRKVFQRTRKET